MLGDTIGSISKGVCETPRTHTHKLQKLLPVVWACYLVLSDTECVLMVTGLEAVSGCSVRCWAVNAFLTGPHSSPAEKERTHSNLCLDGIQSSAQRQSPSRIICSSALQPTHSVIHRLSFFFNFFPQNWELCPICLLQKSWPYSHFEMATPLQVFNCHDLFEPLEFVMKSLSNSDSSQIQYSVSVQLFYYYYYYHYLFPQQWVDWPLG